MSSCAMILRVSKLSEFMPCIISSHHGSVAMRDVSQCLLPSRSQIPSPACVCVTIEGTTCHACAHNQMYTCHVPGGNVMCYVSCIHHVRSAIFEMPASSYASRSMHPGPWTVMVVQNVYASMAYPNVSMCHITWPSAMCGSCFKCRALLVRVFMLACTQRANASMRPMPCVRMLAQAKCCHIVLC